MYLTLWGRGVAGYLNIIKGGHDSKKLGNTGLNIAGILPHGSEIGIKKKVYEVVSESI